MNITELKKAAEHHIKRGDAMQMDPKVILEMCESMGQGEPVAHAVIAGVLFDFMGWLTSRDERIVLSSRDYSSPAVDAIHQFSEMRGFSLNGAKVQDWQTATHPAQPVQPAGAQEPDLLDLKLPIAVRVGGGIFGKGVSLRTVANKLKLIQDTYDNDLKARMSKQSICRENETEAPAAAINEQLLEALIAAKKMCDEALPKFNWGASFLDANAINLLNSTPGQISAAIAAAEAEKARGRG